MVLDWDRIRRRTTDISLRQYFTTVLVSAVYTLICFTDLFIGLGIRSSRFFVRHLQYAALAVRRTIRPFIIRFALISLRFSGFITYDDAGKVRFHFRRQPPLHLYASQVSSPTVPHSAHEKPRESGRFHRSKVTRESHATSNHFGGGFRESVYESSLSATNTHLKRVARWIMWYPVCA
jgi:hypothetical protein